MADKRLKAMLRNPEIEKVVGLYGFGREDILPGVALASAAVLVDEKGRVKGVTPEGRVTIAQMSHQMALTVTSAAALRALETSGVPLGAVVVVDSTSDGKHSPYELVKSTLQTGQYTRPDDYDAAVPRAWKRVEIFPHNVDTGILSSNEVLTTQITADYLYTDAGGGYFDFSGAGYMLLPAAVYGTTLPTSAGTVGTLWVDAGVVKRS